MTHRQPSTSNKIRPEIIYTPYNLAQHPWKTLQAMIHDLLACRNIAWQLMRRNINSQHRKAALGIAWVFLPPIVAAIGLTFASQANLINVGSMSIPYPVYVMLSMTLWQTFLESLLAPLQAVAGAMGILSRIYFPYEAVIIAKFGEVFLSLGIKLILVALIFIGFQIAVPWTVIIAPVALLHLMILGTFIGLMLAPFAGLYYDVYRTLVLVSGFWLFLTPVVYSAPTTGTLATIVRLNPVTPLLVTTRELATTGVISDPLGFWVASGVAIVGLLAAWVFYRTAMPFVIERVGS